MLLYLPTYGLWLNPIERLWRHHRREVTHCDLFENMEAVTAAALAFFAIQKRLHLVENVAPLRNASNLAFLPHRFAPRTLPALVVDETADAASVRRDWR